MEGLWLASLGVYATAGSITVARVMGTDSSKASFSGRSQWLAALPEARRLGRGRLPRAPVPHRPEATDVHLVIITVPSCTWGNSPRILNGSPGYNHPNVNWLQIHFLIFVWCPHSFINFKWSVCCSLYIANVTSDFGEHLNYVRSGLPTTPSCFLSFSFPISLSE